jgi:hypothetical protein
LLYYYSLHSLLSLYLSLPLTLTNSIVLAIEGNLKQLFVAREDEGKHSKGIYTNPRVLREEKSEDEKKREAKRVKQKKRERREKREKRERRERERERRERQVRGEKEER